MKTKQIISLALMLALLVTAISGCGTKEGSSTNNNEEESTFVVSSEMKENEESKSTGTSTAEKKTHSEYVKTYSVYAEQGAVVTWSDPKTGQFRYKDLLSLCRVCGDPRGISKEAHQSRYPQRRCRGVSHRASTGIAKRAGNRLLIHKAVS